MADWNLPDVDAEYVDLVDGFLDRDEDAGTLFVNAPTNPPTGAFRYLRASNKFQEWDGATWVDKVLAVAGGGTGGATAIAARTALGLGTMATQNANSVAITGGAVAADLTGSTNIPASGLAGLISQARLGTGSVGAGALFLADDQTWKQPVPVGTGCIWFTNAAPTGYVICDGTSYLRAGTMAALFAVIGTTFGAADATHFNVPDLRLRIPLGRQTIPNGGTAATDDIGDVGGSFDHVHTGAAHTHDFTHTHTYAHTHTVDPQGNHAHQTTNNPAGESTGIAGGTLVGVQAGSDFTVTAQNHVHGYGGTGINTSTTGSHTHTTNSQSVSTTTGQSTVITGGASPANTGAANPPYFVVNFIIKY